MKKNKLFLGVFFLIFFLKVNAQKFEGSLGIIPEPNVIEMLEGKFSLSEDVKILFEEGTEKEAKLLQNFFSTFYGLEVDIISHVTKEEEKLIRLKLKDNIEDEGYELNIKPESIEIKGRKAGLFYGIQSLTQMLAFKGSENKELKSVRITDEPRFSHRGLMLDVCLHFYPVTFIKDLIDLMAQYKLNVFHWHLTEDQGWRIEIKGYPKLTEIGAFRDQTLIGHLHAKPTIGYDGQRYGGYYTQEEIKDVVKYAAERNITVIPEIELPGHSLAALASYPELGCGDNPGPYKLAEKWGIFSDVYCAGKESTFEFLKNVFDEVLELFPSEYIHIGGDEVPKTRWKECKYCQKRIADNKLKNEEELQSYFIHRIEEYLNSKGRQIIGWDEILEGGLAPNATVQSWRGISGGVEAAKQKHNVIMSPREAMYFDYYQSDPKTEPLAIGHLVTLKDTYTYEPIPSVLNENEKDYIIGVEGALWTEYMPTVSKVEYMLLPRMLALSEVGWTFPKNKNYEEFSIKRVPAHLELLEKRNLMFFVPPAIGITNEKIEGESMEIDLKPSISGARVFYTLNGLDPGETDFLYKEKFTIKIPKNERRIFKTVVISPAGKRSPVTTTIIENDYPERIE